MNQAREKTERIIDILYSRIEEKPKKKPITYRKLARKEYLKIAKKRRSSKYEIRQAIKKQLQYIQRNLISIEQLQSSGGKLEWLTERQYKTLLVLTEVHRQQLEMYENKQKRIDDRIVSISQPHIRPIIRGKAGASVEFGAKLSVSYWNGYVFLSKISWDNFNESGDLKIQVEEFKNLTGCYPDSVHVDQIYRTRENRAWCKEREIRLSGVPLGRRPQNICKATKKQAQLDEKYRSRIEGKFGEGKRRFSLNRVMTKLASTSQTAIAITFLVMNLSALLRQIVLLFFGFFRVRLVLAIRSDSIAIGN